MNLEGWITRVWLRLTGPFRVRDGRSIETAVVIETADMVEGILAEHFFLASRFGARERDWFVNAQRLAEQNDRVFDVLTIALSNGEVKTFYFDISRIHVPGGMESEEDRRMDSAEDGESFKPSSG